MSEQDAPRPALDAADASQQAKTLVLRLRQAKATLRERMRADDLLAYIASLEAAAAERDALAREAVRLRRAVVLALDGPSDGEIGMETTLGRLNRIERQLRAALAPQEGATDGR